MAYFGAPGEVVFEGEEKAAPFIYRIKEDGQRITEDDPDAVPRLLGRLAGRALVYPRKIPWLGVR